MDQNDFNKKWPKIRRAINGIGRTLKFNEKKIITNNAVEQFEIDQNNQPTNANNHINNENAFSDHTNLQTHVSKFTQQQKITTGRRTEENSLP